MLNKTLARELGSLEKVDYFLHLGKQSIQPKIGIAGGRYFEIKLKDKSYKFNMNDLVHHISDLVAYAIKHNDIKALSNLERIIRETKDLDKAGEEALRKVSNVRQALTKSRSNWGKKHYDRAHELELLEAKLPKIKLLNTLDEYETYPLDAFMREDFYEKAKDLGFDPYFTKLLSANEIFVRGNRPRPGLIIHFLLQQKVIKIVDHNFYYTQIPEAPALPKEKQRSAPPVPAFTQSATVIPKKTTFKGPPKEAKKGPPPRKVDLEKPTESVKEKPAAITPPKVSPRIKKEEILEKDKPRAPTPPIFEPQKRAPTPPAFVQAPTPPPFEEITPPSHKPRLKPLIIEEEPSSQAPSTPRTAKSTPKVAEEEAPTPVLPHPPAHPRPARPPQSATVEVVGTDEGTAAEVEETAQRTWGDVGYDAIQIAKPMARRGLEIVRNKLSDYSKIPEEQLKDDLDRIDRLTVQSKIYDPKTKDADRRNALIEIEEAGKAFSETLRSKLWIRRRWTGIFAGYIRDKIQPIYEHLKVSVGKNQPEQMMEDVNQIMALLYMTKKNNATKQLIDHLRKESQLELRDIIQYIEKAYRTAYLAIRSKELKALSPAPVPAGKEMKSALLPFDEMVNSGDRFFTDFGALANLLKNQKAVELAVTMAYGGDEESSSTDIDTAKDILINLATSARMIKETGEEMSKKLKAVKEQSGESVQALRDGLARVLGDENSKKHFQILAEATLNFDALLKKIDTLEGKMDKFKGVIDQFVTLPNPQLISILIMPVQRLQKFDTIGKELAKRIYGDDEAVEQIGIGYPKLYAGEANVVKFIRENLM